jgi:hypothetical protein
MPEITEEEALAHAAAEGIEFVDTFLVEGEDTEYPTREEAEEVAEGKNIIQKRTRKQ